MNKVDFLIDYSKKFTVTTTEIECVYSRCIYAFDLRCVYSI